jgi:hypothetical protein
MERFPMAAVLFLALTATAAAEPTQRCTRETLTVRSAPVTIAYCVAGTPARGGSEMTVVVDETFSAPRGSFSRTSTLRFVGGQTTSRVIEDVPLDQLQLNGILHLTLALHGGLVHIESAILTPGAVTVK